MSILGTRSAYKPLAYPWAFDYYHMQNKLHWLPDEVTLQDDILDWEGKLNKSQKYILEQVQIYLANADTDIADVYVNKYLPVLKLPELRSMLLSIASMEAIHQHSYSYTIDTLGMDEKSYSLFLEIPEMLQKHEFILRENSEDSVEKTLLLDIAIGSTFGEGLMLFSAFALIMAFTRIGVMNGLAQLTTFIARDEDLHTEAMCKVFNTIKEERPDIWTDSFKKKLYDACRNAVLLEEHFIDLAFSCGDQDVPVLKDDVKNYIKYLADIRLKQIGLKPNFKITKNPLPWMEDLINSVEHANFFEVRPTSYSKANLTGSWLNAF
jgi:ribonucleoside-diphosphate reductase beta chain